MYIQISEQYCDIGLSHFEQDMSLDDKSRKVQPRFDLVHSIKFASISIVLFIQNIIQIAIHFH